NGCDLEIQSFGVNRLPVYGFPLEAAIAKVAGPELDYNPPDILKTNSRAGLVKWTRTPVCQSTVGQRNARRVSSTSTTVAARPTRREAPDATDCWSPLWRGPPGSAAHKARWGTVSRPSVSRTCRK